MALTEQERISLLMMKGWGDRQRSHEQVRLLFNETFRHEELGISKSTVSRTIQRFEQSGSVKNLPKLGRPKTATTEDQQFEVAQAFIENPRLSIRKAADELEISRNSLHRNLKILKFHPYKMHLHQELSEDDFDHRVEFCDIIMNRVDQDPRFLHKIVFSDEANFQLTGEVNRHNFRYWSDENPHWVLQDRTQHPQKLNVWAGLYRNQIVGPFFIDGTLNGEKYLQLLTGQIIPRIQELAGEVFDNVWFQQDGAPPHYSLTVRNHLDNTFPNRWIGRRGAIEWPARSPDLAPPDYFLWGYLKNEIYFTKPSDLNELRMRIENVCARIPPEMIERAVENFYFRLGHCQTINGQHFEQYL